VSKERRRKRRLEIRKSRFIAKVPICRLLRVAALAFARSFFAFCAIGKVFGSGEADGRLRMTELSSLCVDYCSEIESGSDWGEAEITLLT